MRARETAHNLRLNDTNDSTSNLIIIGMSANGDAETRRLAHEAGMQYFLPKPFTIAEFRTLIETIRAQELQFQMITTCYCCYCCCYCCCCYCYCCYCTTLLDFGLHFRKANCTTLPCPVLPYSALPRPTHKVLTLPYLAQHHTTLPGTFLYNPGVH